MHEAQLYDSNLFLTLDYAPENLPESRSLEYPHFQNFMKRLRKELKGVSKAPNGQRPIRFFCAGEYGELRGRPHWHAILFNTRFPDMVRFVNGTARSDLAESLWKKGRVVIGEVTPASASYVAGYSLSKVYGRNAEEYYEDVVNLSTGEVTSRRPPFCTMSRRPGIGAWWFDRFSRDLFPLDAAVVDGARYKVPRYYWQKYQESADADSVEQIAHERFLRAMEVDREENTARRREDREEVAVARQRTYSRRGF